MKNVLIVEYLGAIRSMMLLSLEATGSFFAVEAGNGFEALKPLPSCRFNFIITDINSLKLISFVKSSSSHSMQAVIE